MKNIIERIIDLENEAQSISAQAEKYSGELEAEFEKDVERMTGSIEKKAAARIEKLEAKTRSEIKEELEKIARLGEKRMDLMTEEYEKNKDVWQKELVSKILSI